MTHYTNSLIKNDVISFVFGNISYTVTSQLNDSKRFYSYSNIGNDGYSIGVRMNLGNWYGLGFYINSDFGFGSCWQLTPWFTGSYGWSAKNGISISAGIIIGDTTHELTFSIGNGALISYIACAFISSLPGLNFVGVVAASIIFISNLFN